MSPSVRTEDGSSRRVPDCTLPHTTFPANNPLRVRILRNATFMSVKTDRRTQSRKRPLSLVYVELPPSNGGMLRDLNEQGFALRAMMPLHLSEKLPFSISLDNGVRIDGEAIVVRLEDKGHVVALEFAGLAAHSRDQIRRWLEKFEEPLSREAWAPKPPAVRASTMEELRHEARKVVAEPPAQHAEPPEPEPEPPAPVPQLKQLPEQEPPPLPSVPQAAPPVVPPPQEIPLAPPPPPPVAVPTEVAPVPPQAQLEFPSQLVTQPQERALDAPAEQPFESAELPLPKFLRQPEHAPPPPAAQLPPLLKLSSVRPTPPPEPRKEPVLPVANPSVAEAPPAPNPVPLSEILIQPPSVIAAPPSLPTSARAPVPSRLVPPPLEPLSTWESETDAASPGRTQNFTLGRAIGIMVFLTLLVGSVVYHREVGHAFIWLGQQIAGDEPQETSQVTKPPASAIVSTPVTSTAPANSPSLPQQEAAAERKTAATPPAPENPVVPQADANRTPEAAPADSSSGTGTGQDEYQRAMQILKTPGRKAELPEAVRLLWIAVKKNNVRAEITLAELYHQGRGVAKSCDQTKILLSAAARKGSPDARRRLQEFQRQGCRK